MDAIRHLLKDHEEVYKLFNQFVNAGEEAYTQKKNIAEKAIAEILENARKEEEVLFPAFKKKGGEEAEEMVLEGIEEHDVAEFLMNRIGKTKPEDKKFDTRFKVLIELVKHHFEEEELQVFPKAKKVLEGDLNRLGEQMDALEAQMKK